MNLAWYHKAGVNYVLWQTDDKKINSLIEDTLRYPEEGLGQPEALKHELSGALKSED